MKSSLLYLAPLALLLGIVLYHSRVVPLSDFAGYYTGGRMLLTGDYMGAYDMHNLNGHIAAAGYKTDIVSYAPFPPFTSLIFAPFIVFSMNTAKLLFNIASAVLFLFSLARSMRHFDISSKFALVIPVIFFLPLVNNIFFGQAYLLLCSLLLEGFIAHRKKQYALSSILWGIAILFKLFPALIFFFLLCRRKYKSLLYLSAACGVLLIASLLINGYHSWIYYISHILPKVNNGQLNDPFTFIFQSAFMLFKKAFVFDALLNPHPLFHSPYSFILIMALFKALLLTICILFTVRKKEDDLLSFALWIMASILISPNGSNYSLILLVIPLLALTVRVSHFKAMPMGSAITAAVLLLIACNIPVIHLASYPLWAQFPRLYLLILFFVLFAGPLKKYWDIRLAAGLTTLFFALAIPGLDKARDNSTYLLRQEKHLYIADYGIKNNMLVYYYPDRDGMHEVPTGMPVSMSTTDGLALHNDQIWYKGRQMTTGSDRKEKPLLINNAYIVYLSDKDRGVDFYTLRQLAIPLSD